MSHPFRGTKRVVVSLQNLASLSTLTPELLTPAGKQNDRMLSSLEVRNARPEHPCTNNATTIHQGALNVSGAEVEMSLDITQVSSPSIPAARSPERG